MSEAAKSLNGAVETGRIAEWNPLRYFNLYRTALSGLLVILVFWGVAPLPVGQYDAELFRLTAIAYFGFSVLATAAHHFRYPAFDAQVIVQVFIDIVAITLLMHASGGVTSGFGMLLLVAIAGGSVLMQGKIAILFAAIASLAVLTQQIYVWIKNPFLSTNYTHAGILGASLFATAYLVYISARRIRASEALAAKREIDLANLSQLNEHIIQRMQSGILAIDAADIVRLDNESARRLLGLESDKLRGRIEKTVPKISAFLQSWREDKTRPSYLFESESGRTKLICSFAEIGDDAADGALVFLEDASALTQQAHQLKLVSLGRMAASIAHEIRNPLGAISHAGQLLSESSHLDKSDRRLAEMIHENSIRMNTVIENVLQLGRGKPAEPEVLKVREWLDGFSRAFVDSNKITKNNLRIVVEPENLQIKMDPSQLHQIIWNLCENGLRHANGEPIIDLQAGISDGTQKPFLEIRDNGDGIPADNLQQIFEPFFTTRADGSGLGLYIARELCEGNKATLDYLPGKRGACFRISFSDPRRAGVLPV